MFKLSLLATSAARLSARSASNFAAAAKAPNKFVAAATAFAQSSNQPLSSSTMADFVEAKRVGERLPYPRASIDSMIAQSQNAEDLRKSLLALATFKRVNQVDQRRHDPVFTSDASRAFINGRTAALIADAAARVGQVELAVDIFERLPTLRLCNFPTSGVLANLLRSAKGNPELITRIHALQQTLHKNPSESVDEAAVRSLCAGGNAEQAAEIVQSWIAESGSKRVTNFIARAVVLTLKKEEKTEAAQKLLNALTGAGFTDAKITQAFSS